MKFTSFLEGLRVIGMVQVIGDVCLQYDVQEMDWIGKQSFDQ